MRNFYLIPVNHEDRMEGGKTLWKFYRKIKADLILHEISEQYYYSILTLKDLNPKRISLY